MPWWSFFRRGQGRETASANDGLPAAPTAVIAGRARVIGVPYMLPADMEETNRLDFQHYMLRYILKGNYAAPIGSPGSILDVGTGTGRWAREMAQAFPNANVVGLDITPPAADTAAELGRGEAPPANYTFVTGSVLEGLPFPDASFDFTHMRLLVSAIPHDRWPYVISELVRVTRPGGWVESVEAIGLQQGGPAVERLVAWITQVFATRGVDFMDGTRVSEHLRAAGLMNISARPFTIPCGAYGGRVGKMVAVDYFNGSRALGGMLAAKGIATPEEFERVITRAEADVDSPSYQCVAPWFIAYGQRPR